MTPFEASVVAAYFLVMALLSVHGFHRLALIYRYYCYARFAAGEPSASFRRLPRVTVQLPVYNERYVIEDLIRAACTLDYPRDRLEIQVLDDSTDDTTAVARAAVERMARLGHHIVHLHRSNREGFKAGALREGLRRASGEFVAIFDADFRPSPDFLRRVIHSFTDPTVGLVQARWTYRNRDQSLLTQAQAILLDGHFIYEHGGRSRTGLFFNFNGTAGVLRRSMIEDAGGWQDDTLTEDSDLSYRAQLRGWKFVYLPHVEVPSELPTDMASFHVQQSRWAKGLTQTALKLLPSLWRAPLPGRVKLEAFLHLTANFAYPLMIVLAALVLPTSVIRFYAWNTAHPLDLPVFVGTFVALAAFYVGSQAELGSGRWRRALVLMPVVMAVGIGMALSNTRAVIEAVLGIRSPFHRTAKYSSDQGIALLARQRYSIRSGWLPAVNLLLGAFFAGAVLYTVEMENWITAPFLMIFCAGFFYSGAATLWQGRGSRPAWPPLEILDLREERVRSSILTS